MGKIIFKIYQRNLKEQKETAICIERSRGFYGTAILDCVQYVWLGNEVGKQPCACYEVSEEIGASGRQLYMCFKKSHGISFNQRILSLFAPKTCAKNPWKSQFRLPCFEKKRLLSNSKPLHVVHL